MLCQRNARRECDCCRECEPDRRECPYCGAWLDRDEVCDCLEETEEKDDA